MLTIRTENAFLDTVSSTNNNIGRKAIYYRSHFDAKIMGSIIAINWT